MTSAALDLLWLLGFDLSAKHGKQIHVSCSQCQALAVQGVAVHERGCPNNKRECRGCNELVSRYQDYCQDCS